MTIFQPSPVADNVAAALQLTQGARPLTHSSLTPSTSRFVLPPPPPNTKLNTGLAKSTVPKKFRVIDHPGHRRLADGLRALLEKEVRGGKRVAVVFVVDGSKAGRDKEVGAVVEYVPSSCPPALASDAQVSSLTEAHPFARLLSSLLPLLPYTAPPAPTPLLLLSTKLDLLPSVQARSLAVPKLHTALTRELNARRQALSAEGARVTTLGDDDDDDAGSGAAQAEEVLRQFGGGVEGKWRWEDWKGVAWAGGWVGAPTSTAAQPKKKPAVVLEATAEGAVEDKGERDVAAEDGLAELKEWLWMLK